MIKHIYLLVKEILLVLCSLLSTIVILLHNGYPLIWSIVVDPTCSAVAAASPDLQ